jgi:hypothetical protein
MKAIEIENIIKAEPETVFFADSFIGRHGIIRGFVSEKRDRYASSKTKFALFHSVHANGSVNVKPVKIILSQIAFAVTNDILSYHEQTTAAANKAEAQRQKVANDRARMESLVGDYFKESDKYQDARRRLADHFGVKPGQVNIDCHNTNVTVNIGLDEIVAILGQ